MKEVYNDKIGYYGELSFNGFEWEFVTLTGMRKYFDTYEEATMHSRKQILQEHDNNSPRRVG